MAEDIIKPSGELGRSKPLGKNANPQLVPLLGIVKDNIDPTKSGRIAVFLVGDTALDPDNRDSWRTVQMLTPFYGHTRGNGATDDYGNYVSNPSSYGMWMSPPDIGTMVLCLFVNGDMNLGFYIGCVPNPEALQMVPAIGAVKDVVANKGQAPSYGGALRLPVTNINSNNKGIADTPSYLTAAKPIHSYVAGIMFQQGILRDPIRGPISSSAQRETPSRVGWGVSTPGRPIYEGGYDDIDIANAVTKKDIPDNNLKVIARRSGHSIVMDDGDIVGQDNLIRIRTSLGHQILMSDDGQTLMILHSNGQSYVELGKEGTVDIYSTNSINLRTQGDLNLHADNNININANKNLNIQADNLHIAAEKELKQRAGTNFSSSATQNYTAKALGSMSMESVGPISIESKITAFVTGKAVMLNTGKTSLRPKEVPTIDKTLHTDTLWDEKKGFLAAPAKLVSIVSRAPAHAPWANAGQGVNVKTNLDSNAQLPSAASPQVTATTTTAISAGVSNPVQNSTVASTPVTTSVSTTLNEQTTRALLGQIATQAANGPLAAAITDGTAIVKVDGKTLIGIGQYAQSPEQLETAGYIKVGSSALVNSIAITTNDIRKAMPASIFTGLNGITDLDSFIRNVPAQSDSMIKNMSKVQAALQSSGVITGSESGAEIGGLVLSATNNGVDKTIAAIQNSTSSTTKNAFNSATKSVLSGKVDNVMKDISSGTFAAKLGGTASGALVGLENAALAGLTDDAVGAAGKLLGGGTSKYQSLESITQLTQTTAASSFRAIVNSTPELEPNVPQNLEKVVSDKQGFISENATRIGNNLKTASVKAANRVIQNSANKAITGVNDDLVNKLRKIGLPNAPSIADSILRVVNLTRGSPIRVDLNQNIGKTLTDVASATFGGTISILRDPTSANAAIGIVGRNLASGGVIMAASSIASGIVNLPGGLAASASITNFAKKNQGLPTLDALKLALVDTGTAGLNGIKTNLEFKANDLLGEGFNKLGDNLISSLPDGLSSALKTELQNAIGSVAAAGTGIKLPKIAINTNERKALDSAIKTQMNDNRIPTPIFDKSATAKAVATIQELKQLQADLQEEVDSLTEEANELQVDLKIATNQLLSMRNSLPQGDPIILSQEELVNSLYKEWKEKSDLAANLAKGSKNQKNINT
jgi:hypothetical protein